MKSLKIPKEIARSRELKDIQHSGTKKWTINDLQNTTQKGQDWAARTPIKTEAELV